MGVYIELYAPIFNYNGMSLVIKKFEPGGKTTQPRLYKRGNDDIDLDAYIRNAESEFSYWLANSRLKDKEKQQVQEAYSQMILGINDGTFTYKIGGGYNNSIGMSNKTKGFDAAGLAAGFLGNILRNQSVYKAPEEKPDPSKVEWKGNSSVGSALVKYLYGSDRESLKDFIDLDPYDTKTKKRGNVNRSARFKSGLEYIRDNFDNLFTSFTDSDKATALERINSALSAFSNGTIEDNEYLDLGRATGMSNLRDMFFSGETYGSTQQTPGTPGIPGGGGTEGGIFTNEDELRSNVRPRTTKLLKPSRIIISDKNQYNKNSRSYVVNKLNKLDNDRLLKTIAKALSTPLNLRVDTGVAQLPQVTNNYILCTALEIARRKNLLHQFDNDPNKYYIPLKSKNLESNGIGIVYQISPDNKNSILEMDRNDIPYFTTNQGHNEFIALVPSNKKGGILRKFYVGGVANIWDATTWGANRMLNIFVNNEWQLSPRTISAENTSNPSFYKPENALGTTEGYLPGLHFNVDSLELSTKYKAFNEQLKTNDKLLTLYLNDYVKLRGESSDARIVRHRKSDGTWDLAAARKELFEGDTPIRMDTKGGIGHDIYLGTTYYIDGNPNLYYNAIPEGYIATSDKSWDDTGLIEKIKLVQDPVAARKAVVASTTSPDAVSEELLFGGKEPTDDLEEVPGVGGSWLGEKYLPTINPILKTGSFGNFMAELAPDLIGAGRLWASLHTNNRVANTIRPSLKPVLYNPINLHKPLTGDFAAMQNQNRLAAEIQSNASRPFTSDASLAAARQLEGQRIANDTRLKGFMIDNEAIKKSNEDRFNLIKELMYYNDKMVYRPNKKSINQTDRERAQLGATHLKSNWQSLDNFLSGIESRWLQRAEENRVLSNQFRKQIAMDNATRWYNRVMEDANKAKDEWIRANTKDGVTPDITTWGNNGSLYTKYDRMRKLAEDMKTSMLMRDMANIYGMRYTSIYDDDAYNNFIKW